VQDHLAGRPGPAGLDEAQVPGRDVEDRGNRSDFSYRRDI
jgi:hypothetical protein